MIFPYRNIAFKVNKVSNLGLILKENTNTLKNTTEYVIKTQAQN